MVGHPEHWPEWFLSAKPRVSSVYRHRDHHFKERTTTGTFFLMSYISVATESQLKPEILPYILRTGVRDGECRAGFAEGDALPVGGCPSVWPYWHWVPYVVPIWFRTHQDELTWPSALSKESPSKCSHISWDRLESVLDINGKQVENYLLDLRPWIWCLAMPICHVSETPITPLSRISSTTAQMELLLIRITMQMEGGNIHINK